MQILYNGVAVMSTEAGVKRVRLLIIADDFTGALDTGAQFAKAGVDACVCIDAERPLPPPSDAKPVLIIDAETRHLPPAEAAKTVRRIVAPAVRDGFTVFYKKTDSGLRGNIGAELEALIGAAGEDPLCFIPAFPKAGRTTRGGVQYVDGVPVAETAFGMDPFEPVRHSFIPDIIAAQTDTPVRVVADQRMPPVSPGDRVEILVFDAETDGDLRRIAQSIRAGGIRLLAGCAGFAEMLPDLLALPRSPRKRFSPAPGMIVISGSVNPITVAQIRHARGQGFACMTLNGAQKLTPGYAASPACDQFLDEAARLYREGGRLILSAVDSDLPAGTYLPAQPDDADDLRLHVARNIGAIAAKLQRRVPDAVYVYIGGDTLLAAMRQAGLEAITPIDEIAPGVVLAEAHAPSGPLLIITKSGGFGAEDILPAIHRYLVQGAK